KEARAMINTWTQSYFKTEGLRLLYIIPEELINKVLPLYIELDNKMKIKETVRVMVGRAEILTPGKEQEISKLITDLGSDDFSVRETATKKIKKLGRITEPVLIYTIKNTKDIEMREQCQKLLQELTENSLK
ncbi:MAG: hypothetical protein HY606_09845, partial [Planctomycetes bacterium]|nr:hypothetical protein [Planctomycetota bacterium]